MYSLARDCYCFAVFCLLLFLLFTNTCLRHFKGYIVTYMSPVEVFVTVIKFFDQQKVCLMPSEVLDCLTPRVKGRIAATCS